MGQVISAAVTPFTDDDKVDLESAARLYERGLEHGIDGFFIFGSMGEWSLLTSDEKLELAKVACDAVGRRAKVLLGISDTGMAPILRNAERLRHLGHSHWVVLLPGGWAGPADPVDYVHKIADRLDRPMYLYNLPQGNNVHLSPQQFADVLAHPNVVGIKNSAGSISLRKELLLLRRSLEFEYYEGDEWAVDEALALGCDGVIAGFASTAGKMMKAIAGQVESGDLRGAAESQFRLIDIYHQVYGPGARWWSAGQKCALKYMGLISSDATRVPSQQGMPDAHRTAVRACIDANRSFLV